MHFFRGSPPTGPVCSLLNKPLHSPKSVLSPAKMPPKMKTWEASPCLSARPKILRAVGALCCVEPQILVNSSSFTHRGKNKKSPNELELPRKNAQRSREPDRHMIWLF